jgi:hypothetical protein
MSLGFDDVSESYKEFLVIAWNESLIDGNRTFNSRLFETTLVM